MLKLEIETSYMRDLTKGALRPCALIRGLPEDMIIAEGEHVLIKVEGGRLKFHSGPPRVVTLFDSAIGING